MRRAVAVTCRQQTQQCQIRVNALIETLLDARRRANQELDRSIAASAREPLFIKNLENVQGDERDVIFIGTVYGPEELGARVLQRFGPIDAKQWLL